MVITQTNRLLSLDTPLGANQLILTAFHGQEALSNIFHYQLEAFADKKDIVAKNLIGKQISWQVSSQLAKPNYFNGYVGEFFAGAIGMRGYRMYRLTVYPWLWFLTHTCNCRIFQQKSVSDIVAAIFKEYSFSDYQLQLQQTYAKREYCVQYNESDFAFISRLLEEEGIYYFFQHQRDKHLLVLADHNKAFKDCANNELMYAVGSSLAKPRIYQWEHHYQFASGGWSHTDYAFTSPNSSLLATISNKISYTNSNRYRVYAYPGNYQQKETGAAKARLRIEGIEATQDMISAASHCTGLMAGGKFKLTDHDSPAERGDYIITGITHEAKDNTHLTTDDHTQPTFYHNTFTCMPDTIPYRPLCLTPKPQTRGPQTAQVVGPANETIYTDEYGRVKVQFHWDQEGKRNEQSSCWIRVGQLWSGNQWGAQFIPRIGQEVIVDFLEGNPDRPLIIGCVYNGEQKPIYALPNNKWQTGIKSKSQKGANEWRFDDQENKEQVYIHAQKDFAREVENDDCLTVKGAQTSTITKDCAATISEGNLTINVKQGNRTVKLDSGSDALTISQGNHSIKLSAGKSSVEAMQGIEFKVGQSSIKIDNTGITLSGMMIKIEGQTMAEIKASAMLTLKGGVTMIN